MRDFTMPKLPESWNESEKTFWRMLRNALETIASDIKYKDFSDEVKGIFNSISQEAQTIANNVDIVNTDISGVMGLTVETQLPEASEEYRGRICTLVTDGEDDEPYICLRKNDNYVWTKLLSEGEAPAPVVPSAYTLFDNGLVDGIGWEGNSFTRQNFTQAATADLSNVGNGYMRLLVSRSLYLEKQQLGFNCHVATANRVVIPEGAATLNVKASRAAYGTTYIRFGLLPVNAPNSMSDANGGVLSALTILSGMNSDNTFSLAIPQGMANSRDYYVVINLRANLGDTDPTNKEMRISKVWFE